LVREFFLGFIKIHVLHHAAREPVYGLALIEELGRHGYRLGPGTLYPLLHGLEAAGYLSQEPRVVNGRVRKYYVATPLGLEALATARQRVRDLVEEVLEGRGPGRLELRRTRRRRSPRSGALSLPAGVVNGTDAGAPCDRLVSASS
jgi:PadR family transcriptional regulator PadR